MKKIISIIITISMLISSAPAFAISGTGTESNPYLISSANDIAKIHDDLNGYYKLTDNIDMSDVAFEPIGNENEGAFTGTIDGAGYTISNLNINLPENKYVGFVGYLEGTVKNLNITNIDACGYHYIGGIVGYAEKESKIYNCYTSGNIIADYEFIYCNVGGIVGYNKGTVSDNINDCNILGGSAYIGGIAGINYGTVFNCENKTVIESPYVGGIASQNYNSIYDCTNFGNVIGGNTQGAIAYNAGGIVYNNSGTIQNCINYGNINGGHCGGIASQTSSTSMIEKCINYGELDSTNTAGGIVGNAYGSTYIKCCINYGYVSAACYTDSYYYLWSGGICGYLNYNSTIYTTDSANYGYVYSHHVSYGNNSGGILGWSGNSVTINISNCINGGKVLAENDINNCDTYDIGGGSNKKVTCYQLHNTMGEKNDGTLLLATDFIKEEKFNGLNFVDTWNITTDVNSGFPILRNMPSHIELNECIKLITVGGNCKLNAYFNEVEESVIWHINDTSIATISSDGVVTAKRIGTATVTATNSEGMKANCLVYVYGKADSITLNKTSSSIVAGGTETLTYTQNPSSSNETVVWTSSDGNIASVDYQGKVTAKTKGTAIITATTTNSGVSASCTVTVTGNPITSVSLSPTSTTMNVGELKTLTTSISPSQYSGSLTWNSTNTDVATVDNNGNITAKTPGTTIISVTSDTNKTAQCTVTVKAPVKEISFSKPEITIVKGYTEKLVPVINPTNTTDTLSWLSSSTSYASVSSDGTVTANRVGTTTITVTASSGKKAYCVVNVVNPTTPVSSVTIDKSEVILTKTDTVQLNATILPTDATDKNLIWSSSNENIATVNTTGVVTAINEGVARITATANNGMYHECIIKVVSASGSSIVLTSENAIPNAISKVKASIVRNPGISGYKFTIKYDEALLTPVSVTANEEFGGTITTNLDDANRTEFNVVWYSNGDTDIDINGELFTIDFKVAETAELGDYSNITIEYGAKDICNTAGENIALYTESAKVTVAEPLAGDIYEDGDVNIYDLTLLARHMIRLADFTDRQLEAANVTDDDLVDIKDVVKLAQYVVGWTGVELMSLMLLDADVPETPTVTVGTASVNDANEADVPVYIKNNTGIAAYRFVLDYNADDIEIVSITPSDFINPENFGTNLGQENDEGLIVFCYQESNAVADGELFTIKVRYKNPTNTSVSPISIKSAENNFCNQAIENVAVNYETGYALGDDYIIANKVVGDTNFSCELYFDDSYAEQSAKAIIAFYDGDGRMVQLMPKDITVKPGKVDLSIDYDKKAYVTYKLMIWEGLGNLKPITEVK